MKKINHEKKLLYISELNIPNKSAQYIQTLKMCSAFSKIVNTKIVVASCKSKFNNIKKNLILDGYFKILPIFTKVKNVNFINKFIILTKIFFILQKERFDYIFTRSVYLSTFLAIFNYKNILEFHLPNSGFTKILFLFYKKIFKNHNQKFVLISRNLNNTLQLPKKKIIYLNTCVDLKNFNVKAKLKKKTCVYVGSLYKGKGFDLILKLAKKLKKITFYIYGEKSLIENFVESKKPKNLKIFSYQEYRKIPKILKSHKILLMPYSKKVYVKTNATTVEKFMSPIKLIEYLASGRILIASNLSIYRHILKNNFNCYLVNPEHNKSWCKKIKYVFKNYHNLSRIRKNSIITSKKYNIDQRAKKIIEFFS